MLAAVNPWFDVVLLDVDEQCEKRERVRVKMIVKGQHESDAQCA